MAPILMIVLVFCVYWLFCKIVDRPPREKIKTVKPQHWIDRMMDDIKDG